MILEISCLLSTGGLKQHADAGDLCVLLAYEDESVCSRALGLVHRVARSLDGPGRVVCANWKFDFLIDPFLQQVSASEAALADLVIVAAHHGPELPFAVKDWLSLWLSTRVDEPKALAAVIEGEGETQGLGLLGQLQAAARLGGADFFYAADKESLTAGSNPGRVPSRALAGQGSWLDVPGWTAELHPPRPIAQRSAPDALALTPIGTTTYKTKA